MVATKSITLHSGFPDQVVEGKNGFLVPEGDYRALAERIVFLIEHPELWGDMGLYGRELMKEKYDKNALITKQIMLYKKIVST